MTTVDVDDQPMNDIRDIIYRKPSVAVRAAIHGLEINRHRDDFILDMVTFGTSGYRQGKPICFGCMATCALQSITNTQLTHDTIGAGDRWLAVKSNRATVDAFETAIERLRRRMPSTLYEMCRLTYDERDSLPQVVPVSAKCKDIHRTVGRTVLSGNPQDREINDAIFDLTDFAELLEAKGF